MQIGVVSFSDKQCKKSGHGFLAKVTAVLDWIRISVGTEYTNCPREWKSHRNWQEWYCITSRGHIIAIIQPGCELNKEQF